jgi:hypothetical protein
LIVLSAQVFCGPNDTPGSGEDAERHSHADRVAAYIGNQEEYHRKKTFTQELEVLVKKYGLEWFEDRNR